MKKFILSILLFLIPFIGFGQFNSCSGSITGTDIPDYPSTVQIGDGTTGYVKICFTDNSIGTAKCMGTESGIDFWNGDGTYEQYITGAYGETCVTLQTNDGYAELSKYCWSGSANLSWTTVNSNGQDVCNTCTADSDCAGNTTCDGTYCNGCATPGSSGNSAGTGATILDQCGTSFSTSLSGVTTYGQNTGMAPYNFNDFQDLDCNDATSSGGANGEDANFTWEQGLWYKFCPQDAGTWEVNMTASNCTQGNGVQLVAYQGNPGNLHTKFFEFSYGMSTTQTMNITNTSECVYLILDGYAGDVCDVDMTLSCTDCGCALPIELLSFDGQNKNDVNHLKWITATETNSDYFELQRRNDNNENWRTIEKIKAQGTTTEETKYIHRDRSYKKGTNYYRLKQYDRNGRCETFEPIAIENEKSSMEPIKIINYMGQEVDEDYNGVKIYVYPDGSTEKKVELEQDQ